MLRGSRLTPSMVIALVALFVALGGTGYAALTVTSKNVKDNTLTGADVKNNSITGQDVKGLTAQDFTGGLPAGPQGAQGAAGPQGAKGDRGERGPEGPAGKDGKDGKDGQDGLDGKDVPAPEAVRDVATAGVSDECDLGGTAQFCTSDDGNAAWQDNGGAYSHAGFYKDGHGVVHLQGSVEHVQPGGAATGLSQTIFILPSAYRPTGTRLFQVYSENAPNKTDYVEVSSDGRVALHPDAAGYLTSYVSLDGISFRP